MEHGGNVASQVIARLLELALVVPGDGAVAEGPGRRPVLRAGDAPRRRPRLRAGGGRPRRPGPLAYRARRAHRALPDHRADRLELLPATPPARPARWSRPWSACRRPSRCWCSTWCGVSTPAWCAPSTLASVRLRPRRAGGLRRRGCLQGRCLPVEPCRPARAPTSGDGSSTSAPADPHQPVTTLRGGRRPLIPTYFWAASGCAEAKSAWPKPKSMSVSTLQGRRPLRGQVSSTSGGISSEAGWPTSVLMGRHPCPVGDSPPSLRPRTFPPAVIGAGKVEAASPRYQRSSIRPPVAVTRPSPPRGCPPAGPGGC